MGREAYPTIKVGDVIIVHDGKGGESHHWPGWEDSRSDCQINHPGTTSHHNVSTSAIALPSGGKHTGVQ